MRRGYAAAFAVLAIVIAILIGVGAYNAGVHHGVAQSGDPETAVRYWDGHRFGAGFFPLGLLFFPLLIFGIFALFRFAFWGGRWGGGWGDHPHPHPHGTGNGGWGGRESFEEWHRREHGRAESEPGPDPGPGPRPDTA